MCRNPERSTFREAFHANPNRPQSQFIAIVVDNIPQARSSNQIEQGENHSEEISHNFCGNPFVFLRNLWNSLKILLFYWKSRTLLGGVIRVKIQDEIQVQILPLLLGGTLKVNKSMLSDWQCIIYESLSYTLTSLHLQNPLRPHSTIQWMLACKTICGSLF